MGREYRELMKYEGSLAEGRLQNRDVDIMMACPFIF